MPKIESKKKERVVVYPHVTMKICSNDLSELKVGANPSALTPEQAKTLLGWKELDKDSKIQPMFRDTLGKAIYCENLLKQRPFYRGVADFYANEILSGNWSLNGETMTIGRTGLVLDGQHRLIALIFADQMFTKNPDAYPAVPPDTAISIDCLLVFGIKEDLKRINTMNTGRVRSLSDALYACGMFEEFLRKDSKELAKIASSAVNLLWLRTNAGASSFAPMKSHTNSIAFLERHARLLEAIKVVYQLDRNKKFGATDQHVKRWVSPGYAAALLYLMGTSSSKLINRGNGYAEVDIPSEENLDFSNWNKALSYWTSIASRSQQTSKLLDTIVSASESSIKELSVGLSTDETIAYVIKGWQQFIDKGSVYNNIVLQYEVDGDNVKTLAESPTTGGIDVYKLEISLGETNDT